MNAPVRIADLADCLHPRSSVWRSMALLHAYFDESGTHAGSRVVAIAGWVAAKGEWTALEAEWQAVLTAHSGDRDHSFRRIATSYSDRSRPVGADA